MVTAKWKLTQKGWRLMSNEVKLLLSAPAACRVQPLKVELNVRAGKVFLVSLLEWWPLRFFIHYFVVRSTFSLWFHSFFSLEICTAKAWEMEPRSHRFTALFSFILSAIIHPTDLTDTHYFIMTIKNQIIFSTKCFYQFYLY